MKVNIKRIVWFFALLLAVLSIYTHWLPMWESPKSYYEQSHVSLESKRDSGSVSVDWHSLDSGTSLFLPSALSARKAVLEKYRAVLGTNLSDYHPPIVMFQKTKEDFNWEPIYITPANPAGNCVSLEGETKPLAEPVVLNPFAFIVPIIEYRESLQDQPKFLELEIEELKVSTAARTGSMRVLLEDRQLCNTTGQTNSQQPRLTLILANAYDFGYRAAKMTLLDQEGNELSLSQHEPRTITHHFGVVQRLSGKLNSFMSYGTDFERIDIAPELKTARVELYKDYKNPTEVAFSFSIEFTKNHSENENP